MYSRTCRLHHIHDASGYVRTTACIDNVLMSLDIMIPQLQSIHDELQGEALFFQGMVHAKGIIVSLVEIVK